MRNKLTAVKASQWSCIVLINSLTMFEEKLHQISTKVKTINTKNIIKCPDGRKDCIISYTCSESQPCHVVDDPDQSKKIKFSPFVNVFVVQVCTGSFTKLTVPDAGTGHLKGTTAADRRKYYYY